MSGAWRKLCRPVTGYSAQALTVSRSLARPATRPRRASRLLDPSPLLARHALAAASIDLGPTDPVAKRLR
jgi:hypothetical protein